ncbi:hypothetical protein GTQ99_19515 [Kineococcus sp. T13]|uniref:hypothetical protein n=1 Tax=Kineococcus vitellinus TaxID=2696565 RepID=UPI001412EF21|nr:hypothetical protein [Kineococcus vitellinus]NAZ77582.1 hypothetical protein [Kineococcus vitellinus]
MSTDQPRPVRALLRRSVLALSVLEDVDVDLDDDGVRLPGCVPLSWSDVARAAGCGLPGDEELRAPSAGAAPEQPEDVVRLRVADLLRAHAELHRSRTGTVPLAVPVGAARRPAHGWSASPLLGGALELGLGVVVRSGRSERTLPVPVVSARATGRPAHAGAAELARLEEVGQLVVQRLLRDAGGRGGGVLRPVAGCDVPTLLASAALREHLVAGPDRQPGGVLRAVAVPDRTRGWFDLARIDPAYVGAAWTATDPADRGLHRPVLVTREEVALAPSSPRLVEAALRS